MKDRFRAFLRDTFFTDGFGSRYSSKLVQQLVIETENIFLPTLVDQYYQQQGSNLFKFLAARGLAAVVEHSPRLHEIHTALVNEITKGIAFANKSGAPENTLSLIGDMHVHKSMRYQTGNEILFKEIPYYTKFLDKLLPLFPYLASMLPKHTTNNGFFHREFISEKMDSVKPDDISLYYLNLGRVFGIVLVFRGIDVYVENLVAHMPYPVLFDLECLFSGEFTQNSDFPHYSLESTGLIVVDPVYDVSAFSGGTKPVKSYLKPFLVGTEEKPSIAWSTPNSPAYSNIPILQGEKVNPQKYKDMVVQGLKETYQRILCNKEVIEKIVQETEIGTRTIITPTRVYRVALQSYAFPIVNDSISPEVHFQTELATRIPFYDITPTKELLPTEVHSLQSWLIPKFYSEIHSPEIFSEDSTVVARYNVSQYQSWQKHFENIERVFTDAHYQFLAAYK